MPASRDVGANYREMKRNHPDWSKARLQAAALSMAHEAGNPGVKPRKKAAAEDWLINWDEAVVDQFPWEEWVGDGEESDPVAEAKESFIKKWGDDLKRAMAAALFDTPGLPPTPSERSALFAKSRSLPDGSRFLATKDADTNLPRLTFWVSNNFRDSDHPPEILSAAAHQSYVAWAEKNDYHPEAWLWHTPGTKWGTVDWMDYFDGFLVESVLADKGSELVAERLAADPDLRVSHGYVIPVGGRDPADWSIIQTYYQYEISPLPAGKEANGFTGAVPLDLTPFLTPVNTSDQQPAQFSSASLQGVITMPMDPTKRKWLEDKLGPERVKALEAATLDLGSVAKGLGLETKDLTAALVGETPATEPETPTPTQTPDPAPATPATTPTAIDAKALETAVKAAVDGQFSSLQTFLTKMRADLDLVMAGHNKAVADSIRPQAGDSVQYLWEKRPTESAANLLTKEESNALGGPRDDSDNLPPHMKELQRVMSLGSANGHSGPGDALSH